MDTPLDDTNMENILTGNDKKDDLMTKILMNIEDCKKTMMIINQRLEANARKIEILSKRCDKN